MKVAVIGSSDGGEYPEVVELYQSLRHHGVFNTPDASESPDKVVSLGEKLGRLLAEAGHTVIAGGYGGEVSAVAKGAREAGGKVIGFIIRGARESVKFASDPEGVRESFLDRLAMAITEADVCIVLPGINNIALSVAVCVHPLYKSLPPERRDKDMVYLTETDGDDDDILIQFVGSLTK